MSFASRFNPRTGILDFWHEFRKPNPMRWPILAASMMPLVLMYYFVSGETVYKTPDRPQITYITTYDPDRSDEEIIASNRANQEVKDLRAQKEAELAQRKRDLYKALGAAAGMDVEEIAAEADARRTAEEAAEAKAREERLSGTTTASQEDTPAPDTQSGDAQSSDDNASTAAEDLGS